MTDRAAFTDALVARVASGVNYQEHILRGAVARYIEWCADVAGFELNATELFSRKVIAYAVPKAFAGWSGAATGNMRSVMNAVGRAVDPAGWARVPTLAAAEPSAPYSDGELVQLRSWAAGQPTEMFRRGAAAMLSLCAGAGLTASELDQASSEHISFDSAGALVQVTGRRARLVPVLASWEGMLARILDDEDPYALLFRPGSEQGAYRNATSIFTARSAGTGLKPTAPRLRATWVVAHLNAGTPYPVLMEAAGVSDLGSLARFVRFVPRGTASDEREQLRHAECSDWKST